MNKKAKITVFAFLIFLVLCSCQTKPAAWDESIPLEKTATVLLVSMNITSFNGITVIPKNFRWVHIPAGETTLGGNVFINHGGISFQAKGMEFTYTFKAGVEYVVQGQTQDMKWGVSVYEAKKHSQISAENKLAFIPFKNQPIFN